MIKKEKSIKKSPQKLAKRFESDLPEIAKRLEIRVSSPYGYYPEDVDKHLIRLELDVSSLIKENTALSSDVDKYKRQSQSLQSELTNLKMQMSLMEIPDISTAESFTMLGRVETITGIHEDAFPINVPSAIDKPKAETGKFTLKVAGAKNKPNTTQNTATSTTNSKLVKPKITL